MVYLIIVSVIWALSFSLIKGSLTGIDSNLVAFIRLAISFLIFLPFFKFKKLNKNICLHFFFIGAIQYGLMYVSYIYSYKFLEAYQIAILTIFTPIYVVLIYDAWIKKFNIVHLLTALLAVLGAGIIMYSQKFTLQIWKGILFIQFSNLCFAIGQVYFKNVMKRHPQIKPVQVFSLLYLGAVFVAGLFSLIFTEYNTVAITGKQWLTLLYLGVVASGIGFFLWNIGVTKVETGSLAVLNNLKIPLAVLFAFLILAEEVNLIRLMIGFIIILSALIFNEKYIA